MAAKRRLVFCLFALAWVVGCGGSGSRSGNQTAAIVAISPRPEIVTAGVPVTFTVGITPKSQSSTGVNWSLSSGAGGSLSNQSALTVVYNPPSAVPANPSVTLTATAQADSTATDSLTFTITASSGIVGNNYVGAQSPGDVWLLTLDDVDLQFSAIDQTTGNSYAGNITRLPNGFLQTSIFASTDPNLPLGSVGYAVEVPGVAAILALNGTLDKPVALAAQSPCPTLSGSTSVQLIDLGESGYNATQSESFAAASVTQSDLNYSLNLNSYLLGGTSQSIFGQLPSGTCANNTIVIANVLENGTPSALTVAPSSNGLYVIDFGPGNGAAVGSQNFVSPSNVGTVVDGQYIGAVFKRDSNPITTFVGFGPGSGTSITGGAFVNQDTDPFFAHTNDITISLPGVNSDGFLQGTVTDENGNHSPFVALATENGGNFFLFGITTDSSNTTPYVILLAQQP